MNKEELKNKKIPKPKFSMLYVYIIVTIAMFVFAILIVTQSFFNPLNFQSDEICYLERTDYNNPMICSFSIGDNRDNTYLFSDKVTLYAMFVYLQAGELSEISDVFTEDLDSLLSSKSTSVYEIFSQSPENKHVLLVYDLGVEYDYLIVECMPDYPSGDIRLMAMQKTNDIKKAMTSLKSTGLNGLGLE